VRSVIEWAELAMEWYRYELGSDSEEVKAMKVVIENPQGHFGWGAREVIDVGGPDVE
jgi:hypothetical protein